jgi:LuxR family transcriptional regulator, quorum-sensing system regulator BjaR1
MAAEYSNLEIRSVNDFIIEIGHAQSFQELHFRAAEIANNYNFEFVFVVRLPLKQLADVGTNILIGNIPPGWLSDDESQLALLVMHAIRKAGDGINFIHLDLENDDAVAQFLPNGLLDADLGVTDACFFPVHSTVGGRGMAAFFGTSRAARGNRMFELNYLAALLFDKCNRLAGRGDRATRLSKREVECLYWTAAGKTSAEIATILDLSEHTINNYLVAVCQKLNSVNRAHAVAKAMRQGIIG